MNQFFDDEDDGKDFETETKPVSAVENGNNSLPSTWRGFVGDENEPTSYVPTREEVLLLVKHWRTQMLRNSWHYFITSQTGSSELRLLDLARGRIALAGAVVGEEAVLAAFKEAKDDFMRVGDEWHNEVFENGTEEQWKEVQDETWRGEYKQYCSADLKQMEELETKYPGDLIALVLYDSRAGNRSTVLGFSTADSELVPLLEACPKIEVLTTKSRIRRVTANRELRYRGFIRARRRGREWLFDFPGSTPGTVVNRFLEAVRNQIKEVLSEATDEQEVDDLSYEV